MPLNKEVRCSGHVERTAEMRNSYRILVVKHKVKRHHGKYIRVHANTICIYLRFKQPNCQYLRQKVKYGKILEQNVYKNVLTHERTKKVMTHFDIDHLKFIRSVKPRRL